jgi:hypothetical protein
VRLRLLHAPQQHAAVAALQRQPRHRWDSICAHPLAQGLGRRVRARRRREVGSPCVYQQWLPVSRTFLSFTQGRNTKPKLKRETLFPIHTGIQIHPRIDVNRNRNLKNCDVIIAVDGLFGYI